MAVATASSLMISGHLPNGLLVVIMRLGEADQSPLEPVVFSVQDQVLDKIDAKGRTDLSLSLFPQRSSPLLESASIFSVSFLPTNSGGRLYL